MSVVEKRLSKGAENERATEGRRVTRTRGRCGGCDERIETWKAKWFPKIKINVFSVFKKLKRCSRSPSFLRVFCHYMAG